MHTPIVILHVIVSVALDPRPPAADGKGVRHRGGLRRRLVADPPVLAYFSGMGGSGSIMKGGAAPVQSMPAPPAAPPAK
jgi:hypothetical protein